MFQSIIKGNKLFLSSILLAVVFIILAGLPQPGRSSVEEGRTLSDFQLSSLSGLKKENGGDVSGLSFEDLQGEVSLINFWASWCPSCRREHESLLSLAKETNFPIYGINVNDKGKNALSFLKKNGNPYRKLGVDASGSLASQWGVYGLPISYIVDKKGVVRYVHMGAILPQHMDDIRQKLITLKNEE